MTTPPAAGAARTPWQVLQDVLRADAAAPRVTFYERTPGPTNGERIELSGKVLVNWVSKAANLLSEEFDVSTGSRVGVVLPAAHWRSAYWCLAAWALGATVVFVDSDTASDAGDGASAVAHAGSLDDADVLVTDVPDEAFDGDQVVVSLPMLARTATVGVPSGAIDEARELSTYGDVFTPFVVPAPRDAALQIDDALTTYADLTTSSSGSTDARSDSALASEQDARRHLSRPSPAALVRTLAAGGSVVLVRGPVTDDELQGILDQESAVPA